MRYADCVHQSAELRGWGALAKFFFAGAGPSHKKLTAIFVRAGYGDEAPYDASTKQPNKEWRVRSVCRAAINRPDGSQRLVKGLIEELRLSGAFDGSRTVDSGELVIHLRRALGTTGWLLDDAGYLRPSKHSTSQPAGVQRSASSYAGSGAAPAAGTAAQSQAASAREQTRIQRQLRIDAAQPYVWVGIRPSDEHGQLLMLYVGNSGPTVATDVRVTFDPPLQFPIKPSRHEEAAAQLARGIRSLPPGRTMQWHLGVSHDQIPSAEPDGYHVRITTSGPFGPSSH